MRPKFVTFFPFYNLLKVNTVKRITPVTDIYVPADKLDAMTEILKEFRKDKKLTEKETVQKVVNEWFTIYVPENVKVPTNEKEVPEFQEVIKTFEGNKKV